MTYYETLFIIHPAPESGRLKDIILSIEEGLKNIGGKTLSIDLWGKKRLAYLIDKQKYGTYVKLQFSGEGDCTRNFGMELEHNANILSYLTTLIEKTDVVEQEKDLDTQIAGHSRETQKVDNLDTNTHDKTIEEKNKSEVQEIENIESSDEKVIDENNSEAVVLNDQSESAELNEVNNNADSKKNNQKNAEGDVTPEESIEE